MEIWCTSLLTVALHPLMLTRKAAVYVCLWVSVTALRRMSIKRFSFWLPFNEWKIQNFAVWYWSPHLASGINSAGLLHVDAPPHLQQRDRECSIQPKVLLCPCFLGILSHHSQEEKQNKKSKQASAELDYRLNIQDRLQQHLTTKLLHLLNI